MEDIQSASYLAKNKSERYVGVINQTPFFVVLEIPSGVSYEDGEKVTHAIRSALLLTTFTTLADFENFFFEEFKKHNLPITSSVAAGYLKDDVLYLKTVGDGEVLINRRSKIAKLLTNDLSASGRVQNDDVILFTTKQLQQFFSKENDLKNLLSLKKINEFERTISKTVNDKNDAGVGMVAVYLSENKQIEMGSAVKNGWLKSLYFDLQLKTREAGRKKTLTVVTMVIIGVFLIWSVGFGVQRRRLADQQKQIEATKSLVTTKLNQAEEVAFLNMSQAVSLIADARGDVAGLEKKLNGSNKDQINKVKDLINQKEAAITKKEEKKFDEFYDLALDEKNASGIKLSLNSGNLAIFDQKNAKAYLLSLAAKSLIKREDSAIGTADLYGFFGDDIYLVSQKTGVLKYQSSTFKKVIEPDKDWGLLKELEIYNGNLYLVDAAKNDIYKYIPTATGFSEKSSYFGAGEAPVMNSVNSLAIDSSLYLGFESTVLKFTGGVRDAFKTSYPQASVKIAKIFTDKDEESVYVWDKNNGSVYILSKKGEYVRQIDSSILKKASDFIVYQNKIYLLLGSKIYTIEL